MRDKRAKYRRWAVVYILLALLLQVTLVLLMVAGVYKTLVGVLCMVVVEADMAFFGRGQRVPVERGVAGEVSGAKKPCKKWPCLPKRSCDLYIPIKDECAGLRELVCSANGKCPFFKTKERALADRIKSIQRRKYMGCPYRIRRRRCCWKR